MAQIAVFLLYLSTEAVPRPGTYPYPPIVGVAGAHGTIARARSTLRRGDLGVGSVSGAVLQCFHYGRGEAGSTWNGENGKGQIPSSPSN